MAKKRSETTATQVETVETVEVPQAEVVKTKVVERKKCLELCLPYSEKVRLMVMEVLRQESAYEFSRKARHAGEEFDWSKYNAQFRADYGDCELRELLKLAAKFFGLKSLDEVRERRVEHKKRRTEMSKNKFGNATVSNDDSDIEDELIDDIDDLI
ncbi:hypothetical protein Cri9333_0387 [Crinalium epipsammum PCC 9333]|uniref:Uncharacterized protein n=1 Tax=Crinalium epipsammum PCC 9333 TaxID=1173022 RepID=K9VTT0_9CYAN|nr:hypothetical protein [Crinalium epipsammum]AFZ11361.1 hypothetical protein Cri9333_0387 [Crinalium epipsammum PCC 9333]